jgi:hypothetical protein
MEWSHLWPPGVGPDEPVSPGTLRDRIVRTHGELRAFCQSKRPEDLGHVVAYDPVIGVVNIIQGLCVAIYHDELHYRDVIELARA